MFAANQIPFQKLSSREVKFIKSLRLKKHRQQENVFIVEGAKNVTQLLASSYTVPILVGTPNFLAAHPALWSKHDGAILQTDETTLASLGNLTTNKAVLAVARIPTHASEAPPEEAWGLVIDDIRDPGNLGAIVRIADWYNIPTIVCSPTTVDLYNPKVLQASMGSFLRVQVHYTPLPAFLRSTSKPVLGTFTTGNNLHQTQPPCPAWIVIGNEAQGISPTVQSYIQQRITIPRYGKAESLNAAIATAIVCDHWQRQQSRG
ncbi:MAG: RNA methyltransferase [Bacteroidota bacterium]